MFSEVTSATTTSTAGPSSTTSGISIPLFTMTTAGITTASIPAITTTSCPFAMAMKDVLEVQTSDLDTPVSITLDSAWSPGIAVAPAGEAATSSISFGYPAETDIARLDIDVTDVDGNPTIGIRVTVFDSQGIPVTNVSNIF